ncbi:hypothetical protein Poli38472_008200 [Pythium oligandrum]|uniref:Uncharacterized protein n=1 Tax=Pythium oligandrum TaxID=41045 RepID=A0A8K1CNK8_PYTOL|nr:hypothetical protein Poli38472_008200 [Pythium oligandrum]|eukprot:TMW65558.1 hypothetical protein Poli38472_008200 [Pythium oligandrum]
MAVEQVEELRARGNAFYGAGRFEDARACYAEAILELESALKGVDVADRAVVGAKLAQLFSNRAQTYIQERNFAPALQDAARALEYEPSNEKAAVRRLVSFENLERFETAFQIVERILDDSSTRRAQPALFEYAVSARRRLRKAVAQDKAAAQQEQHAIGRMVHENQQLRINFGCLIPSTVVVGQFFDVVVNLGNEFGLFRRDYLQPGEQIHLQLNLRNNADGAFKLVFRETTDPLTSSTSSGPETNGKISLNERGKARFQLAIQPASSTAAGRSNMALALTVHPDSADRWNLLSIISLPFTLYTKAPLDEVNDEDDIVSRLGVHCCRPVNLPGLDQEILLAESPGNLGIGGKLWDSCLVLTRYLSANKHLLMGKSAIELGSGLGLVGIYCAMLGAHVTLTDIEEVVPLLDYNIKLNFAKSEGDALIPVAVSHFWAQQPRTFLRLPMSSSCLTLCTIQKAMSRS